MRFNRTRQELKIEREQRQKLRAILGVDALDIIIIALQWMEDELNQFPDKAMEFGRLKIRASDIEPIKEFLRYG